jgi:flagellar hook-associated protein 2
MSSPITFSGFNDVDFSLILNSIMTSESAPLTALQQRQTAVATRIANFSTLATKTSALENAAAALSSASSLSGFAATSTASGSVAVSAVGSGASAGHYDIVVKELARAQVTASASSTLDPTTTIVATGGALTINGVAIDATPGMTLAQLAAAINVTPGVAATASVVQDGTGTFRLVLSGNATGLANTFTVTSTLSGGLGVSFGDDNHDGISGDSVDDNAVQPTNASVLVNNIAISSASNTLDTAIAGASITLLKKDPSAVVGVDVAVDPSQLKSKVSGFILAYNDLVKFVTTQTTAANSGDDSSIARDPLVRQVRNTLRSALSASYGAGATNNLSQIGVEFNRNGGTLTLNDAHFDAAVKNGSATLSTLFAGTEATPGVFASISSLLDSYTQSSGIFSAVQKQLTAQVSNMTDQIARMTDRLALRRTALQKEFTAADAAMSQLKAQGSSLTSFSASLTSSRS